MEKLPRADHGMSGQALCGDPLEESLELVRGMIVARHVAPADSITEIAGTYDDRLGAGISDLDDLTAVDGHAGSRWIGSASGVVVLNLNEDAAFLERESASPRSQIRRRRPGSALSGNGDRTCGVGRRLRSRSYVRDVRGLQDRQDRRPLLAVRYPALRRRRCYSLPGALARQVRVARSLQTVTCTL